MTRYQRVFAFPHTGTPKDGTGEDRRMESGVSDDAARTSGPPPRLKHTVDISEIGYNLPDSNTAVCGNDIYDMADVWPFSPSAILYKCARTRSWGAIDGVVAEVKFVVNDC